MANEKIEYLNLDLLHPFENNPFQSVDESEYDEIRDSIIDFGIITPLIVNKSDNDYEIISGHRRWQIAKEEISKPIIPRECIRYWLYELRKLNMESLEARRFLINTFLNSVVVFKDKIEIVFNYREGTETVPFNILVSVSDTYYGTPP